MTDQLPADIAEAIEAFALACEDMGASYDSQGFPSGECEQVAAEANASLYAVILKHLRGGVSMSDVIAPLTFNGDDCFHPAGFEVECQCIGCPRSPTSPNTNAARRSGRMDLNPKTGGWRPIATAPRDGTTIWVMHEDVGAFSMRWNPQTTNGLFSPDTGMWEAPGEMTWCERGHTDDDVGPSHWKPFGN